MIWMSLAILAVLSICFWLFNLINTKNTDQNYIQDRKKYFPTRLILPSKAPVPVNPKIKDVK